MRTLIVEDDFTSRVLLQHLLSPYGECHVAVNGKEAVEAHAAGLKAGQPYDLICMDIMMPEMDGITALKQIRTAESQQGIFSTQGVKIVMTTASKGLGSVADAYHELCDAYLVKPINKAKLLKVLEDFRLVQK